MGLEASFVEQGKWLEGVLATGHSNVSKRRVRTMIVGCLPPPSFAIVSSMISRPPSTIAKREPFSVRFGDACKRRCRSLLRGWIQAGVNRYRQSLCGGAAFCQFPHAVVLARLFSNTSVNPIQSSRGDPTLGPFRAPAYVIRLKGNDRRLNSLGTANAITREGDGPLQP